MSWGKAPFIAAARWKHMVAATSVSRPFLTALLLGSIGCSYCCYAYGCAHTLKTNPLKVGYQKATSVSRRIRNNIGRCRNYLPHYDRKQYYAPSSGSLLATSNCEGNEPSAALKKAETTTSSQKNQSCTRIFSTKADKYFQKHHRIPLPQISHDNLGRLLELHQHSNQQDETEASYQSTAYNNKVLIIGDVHGCLTELKLLIQKAIHQHNQSQNFRAIVLVGDLVNKGPQSAEVVKFIRRQQQKHGNVFTVRGNHDDRALAAALGDEVCAQKSKYDWVKKGLSDEDIEWLAELPYTITIPSRLLQQPQDSDYETMQDQDVIVVHAGLLPNVSLDEQHTRTMTTVRDLISDQETKENIAKAWKGPELVIFGHDAKRGLQQEDFAIGLDTGCVYGKQLTGIILPERKIISVDASQVYSPINAKD
mmetsp:Transcript_6065/g.9927  ORF Transcript_6065/g.9927 Transcript_6065/m.9927 type:complete len:422 (+) Transcript_6065:160-1425(+)